MCKWAMTVGHRLFHSREPTMDSGRRLVCLFYAGANVADTAHTPVVTVLLVDLPQVSWRSSLTDDRVWAVASG